MQNIEIRGIEKTNCVNVKKLCIFCHYNYIDCDHALK